MCLVLFSFLLIIKAVKNRPSFKNCYSGSQQVLQNNPECAQVLDMQSEECNFNTCVPKLELLTSEDTIGPSQSETNAVKIENYEWCSDESFSDDENWFETPPVHKSIKIENPSIGNHGSVKQEDVFNKFIDSKTSITNFFGNSIKGSDMENDHNSSLNSTLHSEINIKEELNFDNLDESGVEIKEESK